MEFQAFVLTSDYLSEKPRLGFKSQNPKNRLGADPLRSLTAPRKNYDVKVGCTAGACYYDPMRGFTQMDSWMGNDIQPLTLQKYAYTLSDPINHIDPSGYFGLSDITTALSVRGVQSALSTGSYRVTFKKVAGKVACLAIEEGATMILEQTLTSGVYILLDGDKPYVGRSKDLDKRFNQHLKNTQRQITQTLARFHFEYDIKDQRLVEQFFIDIFEATNKKKGTNKINSIAVRNKGLRRIFDKMELCK